MGSDLHAETRLQFFPGLSGLPRALSPQEGLVCWAPSTGVLPRERKLRLELVLDFLPALSACGFMRRHVFPAETTHVSALRTSGRRDVPVSGRPSTRECVAFPLAASSA